MSSKPNPYLEPDWLIRCGQQIANQNLNQTTQWPPYQSTAQLGNYQPIKTPDALVILSCLALICSVGEDLAKRWFRKIFTDNNQEEFFIALNLYKAKKDDFTVTEQDKLKEVINECVKEIKL